MLKENSFYMSTIHDDKELKCPYDEHRKKGGARVKRAKRKKRMLERLTYKPREVRSAL